MVLHESDLGPPDDVTLSGVSPATSGTTPSRSVAGLDLLALRERDADHLAATIAGELAARGGAGSTIATHWAVVGTLRHVALTVETSGPDRAGLASVLDGAVRAAGTPFGLLVAGGFRGEPELLPTVEGIVAEHLARRSGRVVVFPGSDGLVGTMSVARAIRHSSIDRIHVLAGGACRPDTLLVTRDFVRPRWHGGELVLDVQPAAGGTLVPFETPNPTPCCADHA